MGRLQFVHLEVDEVVDALVNNVAAAPSSYLVTHDIQVE